MKVSIGTKTKEGPWGGGNLFAINLGEYLSEKGFEVIYNLDDDDIDVILLTEPRRTSESSAFTHIDIMKYQQFVNNKVVVIHRINECDERKKTNYVNSYLMEANAVADSTVFVSTWLKNLFLNQGLDNKNLNVILSGAKPEIFNTEGQVLLKNEEPIRIVTHHWGANWNKGFDTYEKLDNMLSEEEYKNKFIFTYIGNIPKKFKFKNAKLIPPLSGLELAKELKKNHIYITGSLNEPSGNHHIEAAQCGLPILYLDSGGMPEYCDGFGVTFNNSNFEQKLNEMVENYEKYLSKMTEYPFNSNLMCEDYEKLFLKLFADREKISKTKQNNKLLNIFEKYIYLISRFIKNKLRKYN